MMTEIELKKVLEREQRFFDREADGLDLASLRIPDSQIDRYRNARPIPWNIPKDALFAHLGCLDGKHVLDYGCGHGENACLLAACGARVCAFDLSPVAIAKAQQRAELHGLADRIQFQVYRAGETEYPSAQFDIVIGYAILHHLHTMLDTVYAEFNRLLKPSGQICLIEPVANSPLLRTLRRWTPVKVDATPDERQLVNQDLEPLRQHFSHIQTTHFYCLERIHRVLGPSVRDPLRWIDHHTQRLLPFLRRYFGTVLLTASR